MYCQVCVVMFCLVKADKLTAANMSETVYISSTIPCLSVIWAYCDHYKSM